MSEKNLIKMCSHCERIDIPGSSLSIEKGDAKYQPILKKYSERISHSICDPCFKANYSDFI